MQPKRYVIDITMVGKSFWQHTKDLLTPYYSHSEITIYLNFIFQQSASEAVLGMSGDLVTISKVMLNLPTRQVYSHISIFQDDKIWDIHSHNFRSFAMGVLFHLHQKVGYDINNDYILEKAAYDHLVIQSYPKGYQVRKSNV